MTDGLTDAVRRLKGLQEDVERLKSAQNTEAEPRLLFEFDDVATADDSSTLTPGRNVVGLAAYNSTGYNTTGYND